VDDRFAFAFVIDDDTDLERRAVSTWSYEHRHRRSVGSESSPVMPTPCSTSSSPTPCLRALAPRSTSTLPERHRTSIYVDAKGEWAEVPVTRSWAAHALSRHPAPVRHLRRRRTSRLPLQPSRAWSPPPKRAGTRPWWS